jgi:hypothetical protein
MEKLVELVMRNKIPASPRGCIVWGIGLDRLETETMGLYPTYGMNVRSPLFIIIQLSLCFQRHII